MKWKVVNEMRLDFLLLFLDLVFVLLSLFQFYINFVNDTLTSNVFLVDEKTIIKLIKFFIEKKFHLLYDAFCVLCMQKLSTNCYVNEKIKLFCKIDLRYFRKEKGLKISRINKKVIFKLISNIKWTFSEIHLNNS